MSLNQDRTSGTRRRRQGRKRKGRRNQGQEPVAEQPPALPPFLGCPVALDPAPADGQYVNGIPVNGTAVNGAPIEGAPIDGNPIDGPAVNGTAVNGSAVNGDTMNGTSPNGVHADGSQLNGTHYDVPHLDFSALNWTALNGTTFNGNAANGYSANGGAPNGSAPDGRATDSSSADSSSADSSAADSSAANGWAALSRVHGDFTADLGQLPVTWSPADPGALALDNLLASAERFIRLFYRENQAGAPEGRIRQVRREIEATGTYWHTASELEFGARVAWRNSAKCIGRLYWRSLQVRDRREVHDAPDVAAEAIMHLRKATNGGRIRPVITIFAPDAPGRPGPRILSSQLVRYAGYENSDGTVLGDPADVGITRLAQDLGWPGGQPAGRFDVLPLIVKEPGSLATLHELPADVVLEVAITHPEYEWFADLGLRWYAVPVISDMYLEIGGIRYPAAPFNGWYMGTEVGSRDFGDASRYDQLPVIAEKLGLSTACDRNLWKDKAMTELNLAVLHSYDIAGVTIADHHTESARFLQHLAKEERQGRACPADWTWIVPPATSSATPVFHRYYQDFDQSPNFYRHPPLNG